ncbi:MAG: P44/Msp2 family outer membrane protein [Chlorobiaceae bacterium]
MSRSPVHTYTLAVASPSYDATLSTGSGIALQGAFGHDFGGYRLEGEVGYQTNTTNKATTSVLIPTATENTLSGNVRALSFLANGYYDIKMAGVEPYITAGAGLAKVDYSDVQVVGINSAVSANKTAFAYQLGAGVAIPVSRNVKIDVRYRYFATAKYSNPVTQVANTSTSSEITTGSDVNVSSNNVLVGIRVGI